MPYKIQFLAIACFPLSLYAQMGKLSLTLEEASNRMNRFNPTMQIAHKAVDIAKGEQQKLNAFWFPSVNATGMYVHLSNKIEVKQPLNAFTQPAKEWVQANLPNTPLLTSILDQISNYSLSVPLFQRNLTAMDVNISWPVFTGGKRIYASRIGKRMVDWAEVDKQETGAFLQVELVEAYYALRMAKEVTMVQKASYQSLEQHYQHAVKMEQNGFINKAERLFAEVNKQEAKREWESAQKKEEVAQQALCALLRMENVEIDPVSPLFLIPTIPDSLYFQDRIGGNYTVNKLSLQESMADNQLRISKSAYLPTIALLGKQTLYAHHLPRNLMPRTMIGIGFTWNLFDGLNREADVRINRLAKESLALGKEKAVHDIGVWMKKLYTELQEAQETLSTLQTTIEMSRELLRIRKKSFEEGMATSTEVVDAEVMLSKVQVARLLACYQLDVSLASLCTVCGAPELFWKFYSSQK